jgi:hypothetical protein
MVECLSHDVEQNQDHSAPTIPIQACAGSIRWLLCVGRVIQII